MTKKALIINDTSNAYHWGCYGTSSEIKLRLEDLKYEVLLFGVEEVYNLTTSPKNDKNLFDDGFKNIFLNDNIQLVKLIKNSDIIIINGEGSLHNINTSSFNLLYIIHLAKSHFQKKVHLVNSSLFPSYNKNDVNILSLYSKILSIIDSITVRDILSYKQLEFMKLKGTLGFDCLPLYIERKNKLEKQSNNEIILGGGLGLNEKIFYQLFVSNINLLNEYKLVYLTGARSNEANDDRIFLEIFKNYSGNFEHKHIENFDEWLISINNAKALISGRFHHTIAASFLDTPTIIFSAATPKNHALCKMMELSPPLDINNEDIQGLFSKELNLILDKKHKLLSDKKKKYLKKLSLNNFSFLNKA